MRRSSDAGLVRPGDALMREENRHYSRKSQGLWDEPEIELVSNEEFVATSGAAGSVERGNVRVEREPLITYAERYGFDINLLKSLGMQNGRAGTDEVVFTYPQGWRKIRHINVRRDGVQQNIKTGEKVKRSRFRWAEHPEKPDGYYPMWPAPDPERQYESIIWCEGETDATAMRAIGFDNAFTLGACTNQPTEHTFDVLTQLGTK